jgi:hypothetical protein
LEPESPKGFPFKGVLLLVLVLLLLLFTPTKARFRVNRSMEHRGSTSHLFDPRNFRTMILYSNSLNYFREAERPINTDED